MNERQTLAMVISNDDTDNGRFDAKLGKLAKATKPYDK